MPEERPKPFVLLVLDGWGIAQPGEGNPLAAAETPNIDELVRTFPTVTLRASMESVGLSWGEQGNSEVGHLTIGAGKIFYQSLPRIALAIQSEEFYANPVFLKAAAHCKERDSALHIVGIIGLGNVHGSSEHVFALLELAKRQGLKKVMVHAILDGRDTLYNSGLEFTRLLLAKMREIGVGRIASLSGRYYAMDRDNRWHRTEKAYRAMTGAPGSGDAKYEDPVKAIENSYLFRVYDEEFVPFAMFENGEAVGPVRDGDAVIFSNFRPDRARQLAEAFVLPSFAQFPREYMKDVYFATMTEYEKNLPVRVAFPPEEIGTCLAKVISEAGLKQLHIAETEKYAHMTFFLNGMREEAYPGEDRVIIPSPRVSSYDLAPEMSTAAIVARILQEIDADKYDVIVANFAGADMVGHTGDFAATKRAAEVIDDAVGKVVGAVLPRGGAIVITADHGNGEEVKNLQTGDIDKEHSTNPVPLIVAFERWRGSASPAGDTIGHDLSLMSPVGVLADVAPTALKILGIPQPKDMTGSPLI